MKQRVLQLIPLMLCMALLVSCGSSHEERVRQSVLNIKHQPAKPITPLPLIKPLARANYQSEKLRSPFYRPAPAVLQGERPDISRPKEPLEDFALDSLKMVGVIAQNDKNWALILTPQGTVFPVTLGNFIGQNYGQITHINPKEVDILESIELSGQWQKRKAVITLTEK